MNAVQIFALETFLERNYFASDEEGTIASLGCASFSTYPSFITFGRLKSGTFCE